MLCISQEILYYIETFSRSTHALEADIALVADGAVRFLDGGRTLRRAAVTACLGPTAVIVPALLAVPELTRVVTARTL